MTRPPAGPEALTRELLRGSGGRRRSVRAAGLTVLETRRTFLNGASVLVWARRDVEES